MSGPGPRPGTTERIMWLPQSDKHPGFSRGNLYCGCSYEITLGVVVGTSSAASIGVIVWVLRGGSLIASLMAGLPAWRMLDPIPIVESREKISAASSDKDKEREEEEERLRSLMS